MKIQEIMTKPAVTCRQTETLNAAAELMWKFDCGAVPVTNDDGRLVGIITDRDICMATYTKGSSPNEIRVCDAMSKVFACQPGDALETAERLMREKQVHRVPIVDGENRLVGLLSLSDLVRNAVSTHPKGDCAPWGVVELMAAISQPRVQSEQVALIRCPPTALTHLADTHGASQALALSLPMTLNIQEASVST
jgi:CBS domain-containing protein